MEFHFFSLPICASAHLFFIRMRRGSYAVEKKIGGGLRSLFSAARRPLVPQLGLHTLEVNSSPVRGGAGRRAVQPPPCPRHAHAPLVFPGSRLDLQPWPSTFYPGKQTAPKAMNNSAADTPR